MTSFLSWVWAQAYKVYIWFGDGFHSLYTAALNAWEWAYDLANEAYVKARQYAYELFQLAGTVAGITVEWVLQKIRDARDGLIEDILAIYDWVQYQIDNLRNIYVDFVTGLVNGVKGLIVAARDFTRTLVTNALNYLRDWVNTLFGWVLNLKDRIIQLLSLLTTQRINAIIAFLTNWLNTVITFFQNPLGFILDVIQAVFVSFLCYVLAWSLGTTKYELPKQAPWKVK